jgi:transcriptional regulator with PAS, ATPase and Fis domain
VKRSIKLNESDNLVLTIDLQLSELRRPPTRSDTQRLQHSPPERLTKNEIARDLMALVNPSAISLTSLGERVCEACGGNTPSTEMVTLRDLEREYITRVVEACGSLEAAAQRLGISYTTLWRKRKRYKML